MHAHLQTPTERDYKRVIDVVKQTKTSNKLEKKTRGERSKRLAGEKKKKAEDEERGRRTNEDVISEDHIA